MKHINFKNLVEIQFPYFYCEYENNNSKITDTISSLARIKSFTNACQRVLISK